MYLFRWICLPLGEWSWSKSVRCSVTLNVPNFVSNFHRRELKTLSTALVGRGSQPLQGSVLFTVNDWWYAENVMFLCYSRRLCFHRLSFVRLLAGLCKNYSVDFHKIQWKGGTWARKKTLNFSGNPGQCALGLRLGGAPPYSAWERCYRRLCINSNKLCGKSRNINNNLYSPIRWQTKYNNESKLN